MDFKSKWNEIHSKNWNNNISIDNWLDGYGDVIDRCKTEVLDLGCGYGSDALYLTKKGYKVIACDYSEVALSLVERDVKGAKTLLVDISKKLPFDDDTFDLIIADLSLHYFSSETTFEIMGEIKRVLKGGGYLLARVNSVLDVNHGAGQGEKLEENYYFVSGYNRRFFNDEDTFKFFSVIGDVEYKYADMLRYEKPKKVIEVKVKKV